MKDFQLFARVSQAGLAHRQGRHPHRGRRGVILLVVLALLSLFVVISLTYVLVASQFRRTARATSAATLRGQDPSRLLDDAAFQVFAGTRNARSSLGPHSLLEDLYGRDGFPGMVGGKAPQVSVNGVQVYPVHPTNPANPADPDNDGTNYEELGGEMIIFDFSYDMGPDLRPGIGNVDDDDDGQTDNLTEVGWRGSDDNLFGSDVSYDPGPDLQPGLAGADDDGNGTTDDSLELGWPGTDDREGGLSGAPGVAGRDDDDDDADGIDNNGGFVDYDPSTGRPDLGEWGAANSDDYRLSPINGYYTGQLLTFLSGPAAGQSLRITGYEIQASYSVRTQADPEPADDVLDARQASGLNLMDNYVSPHPLAMQPRFAVGKLRVMAPSGVRNLNELIGSRFWINGRPLNGTGFGASPQTVTAFRSINQTTNILLGATHWPLVTPALPPVQPWERALLPNAAMFDRTPGAWLLSPAPPVPRDVYVDSAGFGGADEDYDAVDYQNMLLAMRRTILDGTSATESLAPVVEMPSLHRPDLIFYWYNRIAAEIQSNFQAFGLGAAPTPAAAAQMVLAPTNSNSGLPPVGQLLVTSLKRRISLRPLAEDHPNFTGSNAAFAQYAQDLGSGTPVLPTVNGAFRVCWEVNGLGLPIPFPDGTVPPPPGTTTTPSTPPQWDVDNDGDGVGDSVWVDLGFPIQTSADGRRYKALAAILCIDLDSKLNLNTHGSPVQLPGEGRVVDLNDAGTVEFNGSFAAASTTVLSNQLPGFNGQGYGPAEINLTALIRYDFNGDNNFSDPNEINQSRLELYNLLRGNPDGTEGIFTFSMPPFPRWWGNNLPPPLPPREGADGRFGERNPYTLDHSWVPNPGRTTLGAPQTLEEPLQQMGSLDGDAIDPILGGTKPFTGGEAYDYRSDLPNAFGASANLQRLRFLGPYGSPSDIDGDGLLALDLRGQPMYLAAYRPGGSVLNTSGFGELLGERFDDPYEVNLFAAARTGYYTANVLGNPVSTTRDNPFRPDELEALLRAFDPDAGSASNRLSTLAPALAANARLRALVTTESWDLPVPSLAVTFDWVRENDLPNPDGLWPQDVYPDAGIANEMNPSQTKEGFWPLAQPGRTTLVDLVRAALSRNDPAQFANGGFDPVGRLGEFANGTGPQRDQDRVQLNLALASSGYDPNTSRIFTGLLSGELLAGLKFDLNRPLGNGRDADTSVSPGIEVEPNAVVDDAREVGLRGVDQMPYNGQMGLTSGSSEFSHEPVWNNLDGHPFEELPTGTTFPPGGFNSDLNGDGKLDAQDYLSRYEYVKTLYVLLHLLADQGLAPFVFDFVEEDAGSENTKDNHEKARLFAQWAVNVVDFRDRDSIMTGFEYDVEPFKDNNGDGLPWDVDGFIGMAPGADGAWGVRGEDDNSNRFFDEWEEAGAAGDDVTSPDDNTPTNEQATNPWRRVVWGCERPELLITETLAFHDRRTTDESNDNGVGKTIAGGDSNFDQMYRPRGSLFIELYNPGQPVDALYTDGTFTAPSVETSDPNLAGVQLDKLSAPDTGGNQYPVWRMVVQPTTAVGTAPYVDPFDPTWPTLSRPGGVSGDNIALDNNPSAGVEQIWRTIYFANVPTASPPAAWTAEEAADVRYFPDAATGSPIVLPPGRFAVLAPTDTTALWSSGSNSSNFLDTPLGKTTMPTSVQSYPRWLRVQSTPTGALNGLQYFDDDGMGPVDRYPEEDSSSGNQSIQPPRVLLMNTATNATGTPIPDVRFSISEPKSGYPALYDQMIADTEKLAGMQPKDTPWDRDATLTAVNQSFLILANVNTNGTFDQVAVVYLQRLANPLRPWDAKANPYLTVDRLPIDLTVYNGTSLVDDPSVSSGGYRFNSRQRGSVATGRNFWSQESTPPLQLTDGGGTVIGGGVTDTSAPLAGSTLGYLNLSLPFTATTNTTPIPPAAAMAGEVNPAHPLFTFGWRYHRDSTNGDKLPTIPNGAIDANHDRLFVGDPISSFPSVPAYARSEVFPWLNWNNRPFISAYELLQVPVASPSQLLGVPVDRQLATTNGAWGWNIRQAFGEFARKNDAMATAVDKMTDISFGHLAPFFMKDGTALRGTPPGPNPNPLTKLPTPGPGFSRLLELVHVPTRFNGADRWLNPGTFEVSYVWSPDPSTATNGMDAWEYDEPYQQFDVPTAGYAVPLNKVNEYREPGRINLNTVFDPIVWRAMTHDPSGTNDQFFWNQIWKSRRGYGFALSNVGPGNPLSSPFGFGVSADFSANSPSYFSNPFRGAGGNFLVPLERLRFNELDNSVNANVRTDLDTGWLRPLPLVPGGGADVQPLFAQAYSEAWRNTTLNPSFRYQFLNKLGSTVTNRSNVFAVWVTIGYFEVEAVGREQYPWSSASVPFSTAEWGLREFFRAFPDGFRLGRELGTDTGDVERHRAFYLFDRSLPVAFERGQRHNVEKAILLRRTLE